MLPTCVIGEDLFVDHLVHRVILAVERHVGGVGETLKLKNIGTGNIILTMIVTLNLFI